MKKPIIELTDLDFSYNGLKVLSKINLTVYEGDFLAVLGPNAGGKTTLLKIMLGLLVPEKGLARVFGLPPGQASQRMGYVPQAVDEDHDFPISVFDVTLMGRLKRLNLGIRYSPKDKAAAQARTEADMPAEWKALKKKEEELAIKERTLKEMEANIKAEAEKVQKLHAEIKSMLDEAKQIKDQRVKKLVDMLSNTKAKKAAEILQDMDDDLAVKVLSGMRGRQAGEILSFVESKKAAKLSEALTKLQIPFAN